MFLANVSELACQQPAVIARQPCVMRQQADVGSHTSVPLQGRVLQDLICESHCIGYFADSKQLSLLVMWQFVEHTELDDM